MDFLCRLKRVVECCREERVTALPDYHVRALGEEYERIIALGGGENLLVLGVRSVQKQGVCWIGLLCIGWKFGGLLLIFWCCLIIDWLRGIPVMFM